MLRISTDVRKMGGYTLYFVGDPTINLGCVYYMQLSSYNYWAKYIITLIIFKHIPRDLNSEAINYFYG